MILGYDHVQIAVAPGGEDTARAFYGDVLEMSELPKPAALAGRGGCWFAAGSAVLHLGVQAPFRPAAKAHPAFVVDALDELASRLAAGGHELVHGDGEVPGVRRFHTYDPFGNRLEFRQA